MVVNSYLADMKNALVCLMVLLAGCTDVPGASKVLKRNNYKPISVGGYRFWAGGKDDTYRTAFKAIAPNGDTVTGTVTRGYFKGSTIRLDD